MAISIIKQTIHDGPVNLVVRCIIEGDTEYSEDVLINVSDYSSPTPDGTSPVRVMRIEANLISFSAQLLWVATSDVQFAIIPEEEPYSKDFYSVGGLPNPKATGVDGDISITTTGFASPDHGEITLWMKKT